VSEAPGIELALRLSEEQVSALLEELTDRVVARASERLCLEAESYINTKEAATYLACQPQRIYELVHEGRLPHYKDGAKRLLFRRSELDGYLESRS
jgi:excisionase family DNA binding protein